MKSLPIRRKMLGSAACATAFCSVYPAFAQEAGPQQAVMQDSSADIVVTAQKRDERLKDVPLPVAAISGQDLLRDNSVRLRDFATSVPGFTVIPSSGQRNILAIRGVTSGDIVNPTVGVMVDDVPYGASTSFGSGLHVPDFDPGDLQRVEVLRGPQGTLYGASSMGGLVKFVTVDPSTEGVSGRVEVGANQIAHSGDPGYNARLSLNVPISDVAAFRVSAFHRRDGGYVDNVRTGERDVNRVEGNGVRFAALYRPSANFSAKFSALYQQLKDDGSFDVDIPTAGFAFTSQLKDLQQYRLPQTGLNNRSSQAYSLLLEGTLGGVELTSLTGYNKTLVDGRIDVTYNRGAVMQTLFGVPGAAQTDHVKTSKVTQELRALFHPTSSIDLLIGGFYTHEKSLLTQDIGGAEPADGQTIPAWRWSLGTFPTRYEEVAAFSTITVRFTDKFDVQLGGRQSFITYSADQQTQAGPRWPNNLVITPAITAKSDVFTYLITPRFKPSDDLTIYARISSGYRTGGPNGGGAVALGLVPPKYEPDRTQNYEVGLKAELLDKLLFVDLSAYYINWKKIQILVQNPATQQFYTGNAAEAKSAGVELSAELRPAAGLTLSGFIAYNDAVLKDPIPSTATVVGASGDRLPTTPRWSGNIAANYRFDLSDGLRASFGATLTYVGDRLGVFVARNVARQVYPSYARVDLRAGLEAGPWSANIYATNVGDVRGMINGGTGNFPPFAIQYIQPRTIGLSVARTF